MKKLQITEKFLQALEKAEEIFGSLPDNENYAICVERQKGTEDWSFVLTKIATPQGLTGDLITITPLHNPKNNNLVAGERDSLSSCASDLMEHMEQVRDFSDPKSYK